MTISKVFTEKKPITAKTIIDKALSYIGTYDGGNNNVIFNTDYYGKEVSGQNYPWCAAFVWDIFRMCKAEKLFCDGAKTAYCPYIHSWGQRSGQLVDKTKELLINNFYISEICVILFLKKNRKGYTHEYC